MRWGFGVVEWGANELGKAWWVVTALLDPLFEHYSRCIQEGSPDAANVGVPVSKQPRPDRVGSS